ncbi:MAG TPA: glucose-1-phosphate cytidylyltransferase [Thermoanaerobaculia bacterium]|nr:glucose-1-phosphate cytidylyltransferase [Thermoanaerobaculia bacterium]
MTRSQPYKVVILCGGIGTRLREETEFKPKPLVEIGERPILWHIMKHYSQFGFRDFILALGYRGEMIVDYFENYSRRTQDYTLSLDRKSERVFHGEREGDEQHWRITFAWTGQATMTGGRIKKIERYIEEDLFLATYGDGLSDIDISEELAFHRKEGKIATLAGVHLPTTFGVLEADGHTVAEFREKPVLKGWINGGFFVFNREFFSYLDGDDEVLEERPMKQLVAERQLSVFPHEGFWKCMDTYKDFVALNQIWTSEAAPWKTWNDEGVRGRRS